jgi:hypothetical protein
MCNLYSVVTNREAVRRIAKAMSDTLGNFADLPGIYPLLRPHRAAEC